MNVIINNTYSIPAIHYITTIYTYMLVHPLARAPETRLTYYLVARPGATVDGAKYITRSPRRLNIRQRWPDTTTYVPAILWPSSPTTQKGHNRYTTPPPPLNKERLDHTPYTGPNQTWEIGRVSMITRLYVGKWEEKITMEYEKLLSLLCFVNAFPKTKRRKCPQYTSE